MHLEHRLDLLRIHLLAPGVDAERSSPEETNGAVGVDRRHVAGKRPAHAVDLDERARRALRVLVVAERYPARGGEPAHATRARLDRPQVVVEHDGEVTAAETERPRRRSLL